jgi:hypothetical protein
MEPIPPPPQSNLPPQPVLPTPPKNNSGLLIGILLLLLGIIVGVALSKTTIISGVRIPYLPAPPTPTPTLLPTPSPTPTPTADWKTYKYINNEFSFKYPPNWYIEPTSVKEGDYINFFLEGTTPDLTKTMDRTGNEILRIMVYGDESIFNSLKNIVPPPTIITVAGKTALKSDIQVNVLIGSTNKRVLDIEVREGAQPYIDQILSTFKFVDQSNQITPTQGQRVNCPATRAHVCPMLCIQPPPYICGSNGKSYCSDCQACNNPGVTWYVTQDTPCTTQ